VGERALRELSAAAQAIPGRTADGAAMTTNVLPRRRTEAAATAGAAGHAASLWQDHAAAPDAPAPAPLAPAAARRRPARKRPVVVDVLAAAAGIGLGVTIGLAVTAESAGSLSAPGGIATALGRLAGLLAAYAMIVVVLLVARVPPLERAIGQDRLVAWHRRLGPWPLYLLLAHAVLITVGYARQANDGVLHQFGQLLWTYPGILAATVGSILLLAAGITSYRLARRRMAYETWWSVHLYTYLALFLSFSHQIGTGASFVGHPAARFWWTMLWLGTLAVVVAARVGLPVWRSLYHRVRVVGVQAEGPGVVSILLRGRRLDRLPVAGGQFFQWRFLRRGLWWQAHPYSLSAAPAGDLLRITVKDLGDHSAGLARLRPGTPVAIEGPYGTFTADRTERDRVLLVGAGVGTAPVLALLQELPAATDVTVLLRASTRADLVLRDEVAAEVARRDGRLVELVGSRDQVSVDAAALRRIVPDLGRRDVFLCGPDALSRHIASEVERAGVPERRIHFESFTF
jgi:predicted ferric reductase